MSLFKEAQSSRKPPRRPKPQMVAYPDYTKSLVTQRRQHPVQAGLTRAGQTGLTAAVLGALVARLMSDKPQHIAAGALAGGAVGAVPGFVSGKREAESDYSKLLFLRRRAGINEPGELDALLQHPELLQAMSSKAASVKTAMSPAQVQLAKAIAGALAGGAAGAGWGYEVSPRVSGYDDVEPARRISGFTGTATGALLGAILGAGRGSAMAKYLRKPSTIMAVPTGIAAGEIIPTAVATMHRQSRATKDLADATRESAKALADATRESMHRQSRATKDLADATRESAIPLALKQLGRSGIGRGMGAGAGVAGIGALVSGLMRAKTEDEIRKNKSRAGMVGSDFLKYVIPAMVGGGVVGSLGTNNG